MMKKIILLTIISMFVCYLSAQTLESDILFGKGVEEYNRHHYKQAITDFEQSRKLDSTNSDMTIDERKFYNNNGIANCFYHLGQLT